MLDGIIFHVCSIEVIEPIIDTRFWPTEKYEVILKCYYSETPIFEFASHCNLFTNVWLNQILKIEIFLAIRVKLCPA